MHIQKRFASAEDLRLLVQNAVNATADIRQHNDELVVHEPFWLDPGQTGCNWSISGYMGLSAYAEDFRCALRDVQRDYNLKS